MLHSVYSSKHHYMINSLTLSHKINSGTSHILWDPEYMSATKRINKDENLINKKILLSLQNSQIGLLNPKIDIHDLHLSIFFPDNTYLHHQWDIFFVMPPFGFNV